MDKTQNKHSKWWWLIHLAWLKFGLNQLEPIIPLKANKDVLRKLHANSIANRMERNNHDGRWIDAKPFAYNENAAHLNKTSKRSC